MLSKCCFPRFPKWFQSGFKHLFGGLVNPWIWEMTRTLRHQSRAGTSNFQSFFEGCSLFFLLLFSSIPFPCFLLSFPFLSSPLLSSPLLSFPFLPFSFLLPSLSSSLSFPSFLLSFPFPSSPFRSFSFLSFPFLSFPLRYNLPMSHIEKEVFALRINEF